MFKLLASVIFISIIVNKYSESLFNFTTNERIFFQDFYYCVIHLQSYTICNEKSNMIKTNVTLKTGLNNNFSVDIDAMLPISLGDNIRVINFDSLRSIQLIISYLRLC